MGASAAHNGSGDDLRSIRTLSSAVRVFAQRPSPRFLLSFALGLWVCRLFAGRVSGWDGIAALAVALYWPFQEWFLHIYVLHARPRKLWGRHVDLLPARVHRAHHKHPWKAGAVFLPMRMLVVLAPVSVAGWWIVSPSWGVALTGAATTASFALLYEWTHYLTHTYVRPRTRYYAWVCRRHRLHHFKNEAYWHGFVAPMVDDVMGTAPDPSSVGSSPRCRDLDATG